MCGCEVVSEVWLVNPFASVELLVNVLIMYE